MRRAQTLGERIVGLKLGEIVYDGPPDKLTPAVLTQIYGEEDWASTIRKADDETEAVENIAPVAPSIERDRLAGLT